MMSSWASELLSFIIQASEFHLHVIFFSVQGPLINTQFYPPTIQPSMAPLSPPALFHTPATSISNTHLCLEAKESSVIWQTRAGVRPEH